MAVFGLNGLVCLLVGFVAHKFWRLLHIPHRLLAGLEFFLPPSEEAIQRVNPQQHKKKTVAKAHHTDPYERLKALQLQVKTVGEDGDRSDLANHPQWDVYSFLLLIATVVTVSFVIIEVPLRRL